MAAVVWGLGGAENPSPLIKSCRLHVSTFLPIKGRELLEILMIHNHAAESTYRAGFSKTHNAGKEPTMATQQREALPKGWRLRLGGRLRLGRWAHKRIDGQDAGDKAEIWICLGRPTI